MPDMENGNTNLIPFSQIETVCDYGAHASDQLTRWVCRTDTRASSLAR